MFGVLPLLISIFDFEWQAVPCERLGVSAASYNVSDSPYKINRWERTNEGVKPALVDEIQWNQEFTAKLRKLNLRIERPQT